MLRRAAAAMVLARKLIDAIEGEVVSVGGERVRIEASFGIGCYPRHADTIDTVFQVVDGATYANKKARKEELFSLVGTKPLRRWLRFSYQQWE